MSDLYPAYVLTREDLPDEAIRVSYSQLSTFRQCPQKWYWSYVDGWRPKTPSFALSFGTLWHSVLEKHYQLLMHKATPAEIGMAVGKLLGELDCTEIQLKMLEFMYGTYVCDFKMDEQWQIRAVEKRGFVYLGDIPAVDRFGNPEKLVPVYLEWVADLIVFDHARHTHMIVDHKSASSLTADKMLELSDQLPAYQLGMAALKPDLKIGAVAHNESRKPKMRADGTPPDSKVPWHQRVIIPAHSAYGLEMIRRNMLETVRLMQEMRIGYRPATDSPDESRCGWKCDYLDVHLMVRRGIREDVAMGDFDMEQRDR